MIEYRLNLRNNYLPVPCSGARSLSFRVGFLAVRKADRALFANPLDSFTMGDLTTKVDFSNASLTGHKKQDRVTKKAAAIPLSI